MEATGAPGATGGGELHPTVERASEGGREGERGGTGVGGREGGRERPAECTAALRPRQQPVGGTMSATPHSLRPELNRKP